MPHGGYGLAMGPQRKGLRKGAMGESRPMDGPKDQRCPRSGKFSANKTVLACAMLILRPRGPL